jgi:two-component system, OmpR family, sensor histidine kinase KdpD
MSTCELTRATAISDIRGRDRARVTGTIVSAETTTVGSGLAYRCVLNDGTGELDLLFLGRAAVAGLAAGIRCSIEGVVTARGGRLAVWNPRYEVQPAPRSEVQPAPRCEVQPAPRCEVQPAPRYEVQPAPHCEVQPAQAPPATDVASSADAGAGGASHFRVYLAAAAGAGKTIAMLDEGQRRRALGADVVIAVVEDHERPLTQAHAAGLEIVPRRASEYHGARFEEMDLDAVLRRKPGVALADELAHTNVPGAGPNAKRWQDVLDLLDAGIDVITTVNIQHLESVADTVEQITQVRVRERVPEWVVRRADQIEFVDASPGKLRHRLLQGEIYPAGQVSQALTHFFRTDNLTALRELALRFLAGEPAEDFARDLARIRARDDGERMLVGVAPVPGTEAMVRRAARMAARIQAGLEIVNVASQDAVGRSREDGLARLRHVAADVGATWRDLDADDLASGLVAYAKHEQVTQIVVGSSQRSRWQELIGGGSIVRRVSRLAGQAGIDVHILALREAGR